MPGGVGAGPVAADLHCPLWRDARTTALQGNGIGAGAAAPENGNGVGVAPLRGCRDPQDSGGVSRLPWLPPGQCRSFRPDPCREPGLPQPARLGCPGRSRVADSPALSSPSHGLARARPATSHQGRGTGVACLRSAGSHPAVHPASIPALHWRDSKAAGPLRARAAGSRAGPTSQQPEPTASLGTHPHPAPLATPFPLYCSASSPDPGRAASPHASSASPALVDQSAPASLWPASGGPVLPLLLSPFPMPPAPPSPPKGSRLPAHH